VPPLAAEKTMFFLSTLVQHFSIDKIPEMSPHQYNSANGDIIPDSKKPDQFINHNSRKEITLFAFKQPVFIRVTGLWNHKKI
jgi:hypothetical protein